MRKFAVIKEYENEGINLPVRSTEFSAGYDIECAEDILIPSIWNTDYSKNVFVFDPANLGEEVERLRIESKKGTLVRTGLKVYCNDDEYVALYNRSSNFNKFGLMLANNTAVLDRDYVDNDTNEGHIYLNLLNFGAEPVFVKKGQKVAQAIFHKFIKTDDDNIIHEPKVRTAGFGSTDI